MDDIPPVFHASNGRRSTVLRRATVLGLRLRLSRQPESVGLARQVLDTVLESRGVEEGCHAALLLALSEACANVVQHAEGADDYEVRVSFEEDCCIVDILDNGPGTVLLPVNPSMPDITAECGRGLAIMAMSTDSLRMTPRRPHGLAVRFTKRLASPGLSRN